MCRLTWVYIIFIAFVACVCFPLNFEGKKRFDLKMEQNFKTGRQDRLDRSWINRSLGYCYTYLPSIYQLITSWLCSIILKLEPCRALFKMGHLGRASYIRSTRTYSKLKETERITIAAAAAAAAQEDF